MTNWHWVLGEADGGEIEANQMVLCKPHPLSIQATRIDRLGEEAGPL